ncbi:hypothetical protein K227x_03310 [Rubripirellula lacrimiformis]|uniref:Uncharacterized protein n=1 Tax=Rubripirellula lacrimiformis TaxID=1930273 RepID=A0A517N498_9BACT|nr:hypothetical protein K227x_03310 [Rubripirellula lacrimiformis]
MPLMGRTAKLSGDFNEQQRRLRTTAADGGPRCVKRADGDHSSSNTRLARPLHLEPVTLHRVTLVLTAVAAIDIDSMDRSISCFMEQVVLHKVKHIGLPRDRKVRCPDPLHLQVGDAIERNRAQAFIKS